MAANTKPLDPELQALDICWAVLSDLSHEERLRVLSYLLTRTKDEPYEQLVQDVSSDVQESSRV